MRFKRRIFLFDFQLTMCEKRSVKEDCKSNFTCTQYFNLSNVKAYRCKEIVTNKDKRRRFGNTKVT